ncbi:hypothetical protein GCM10027440_32660 [Nocardiopsis coralliicola]
MLSWVARSAWSWARSNAEIRTGTRAARRFAAYGPGTSIAFPTATVFGEPWIEIGSHTLIGADITLSAGMLPGLELGPATVLRIGDGCMIGRGTHVVAHTRIDIGDEVYTGPYVYITDQSHVYADPDISVGRQWPVDHPVVIGSGSWIGANAVVLPGARLGRNSVVAAGAVVRAGDYPDHSVIAGTPGRVVRRYDPAAGWIPPLPEAGEGGPRPTRTAVGWPHLVPPPEG